MQWLTNGAGEKGAEQPDQCNNDDLSDKMALLKVIPRGELYGKTLAQAKQLTGVAKPNQPEPRAQQLLTPGLKQFAYPVYSTSPTFSCEFIILISRFFIK
jgi:hypothetical protein